MLEETDADPGSEEYVRMQMALQLAEFKLDRLIRLSDLKEPPYSTH